MCRMILFTCFTHFICYIITIILLELLFSFLIICLFRNSLSNAFRWRSALLWRTFFTTAVVAVVLRSLMVFCQSGKCGLFGQGGLIMFDINSTVASYTTPDLVAVILLGVIGGIFGSLYNYLVDKVLRIYSIINEYALKTSFW